MNRAIHGQRLRMQEAFRMALRAESAARHVMFIENVLWKYPRIKATTEMQS